MVCGSQGGRVVTIDNMDLFGLAILAHESGPFKGALPAAYNEISASGDQIEVGELCGM
jgi:hypothetical protein